jgi:hypothetical protein
MTKERTDKSRYVSPSTGEYCTCAQYIAEIMCTRMAQKENEGTQSYKFWNTKKWKKTYSFQVILANRLAATYSCAAIVKAINSKELSRAYSLRYPNIEAVIQKYQKIIESEKKDIAIIDIQETPKSRSSSYGKKSSLQRLRNIDGKEEKDK